MRGKLGPWDVAALAVAALLYLDVLTFAVLAAAGIGLLIVNALETGFALGVLLLVGLGVYLPGRRRMGKGPRRALLGALWAGGAVLALFCAAIAALALYTASYQAGL